jgi:HlyD family secretion protein
MRGKWLLILIAATAGTGAIVLALHWKGRAVVPPRAQRPAAERATEVTLTGKLRAQHVVSVKADIDGDVDSFTVDVGEDVIAGQVLAQVGTSGLESQRDAAAAAASAAEAQASRAESNLANARLEASRADADRQRSRAALDKAQEVYDRQQMLNQVGATPRLTWEKAQHDLQKAQEAYNASLKAAQNSVEAQQSATNDLAAAQKTTAERNQELATARDHVRAGEVHSPVDGIVVARNGEVGKPAGDDLFTIATDMSALEVAVEPGPDVLKRLRPGDPAQISITGLQNTGLQNPGLQNTGLTGRIREIKDNSAIVEFNCTLAGARPGMPVEVRLKIQ